MLGDISHPSSACVCVCVPVISLSWLSSPVGLLPCCNMRTAPLSLASPSPSLLWFLPPLSVFVCMILHNLGVIDHLLSISAEMWKLGIFLSSRGLKRKLYPPPPPNTQTVWLLCRTEFTRRRFFADAWCRLSKVVEWQIWRGNGVSCLSLGLLPHTS